VENLFFYYINIFPSVLHKYALMRVWLSAILLQSHAIDLMVIEARRSNHLRHLFELVGSSRKINEGRGT